MLKKYKAKSCVSVSVVLATGGSTHITFTPKTGGGSVYYTDNAKIQEGLEKHPKFGKLFTLDGAQGSPSGKTAAPAKPAAPATPAAPAKPAAPATPAAPAKPAADAAGVLADDGGENAAEVHGSSESDGNAGESEAGAGEAGVLADDGGENAAEVHGSSESDGGAGESGEVGGEAGEVGAEAGEVGAEAGEGKPEPTVKVFRVLEDAKDFLADKFSISRSKLRTKADCEYAAAAKGLKIVWTN